MTELFNLAACKALHMFQPSPPKISIGIEISQPPMDGGLSSIQESMNIGGEPHRLSYINSDEASLLRQLGGSGQPVNGVPAYAMDADIGSGWDGSMDVGSTSDFGGGAKGWSAQEKADAQASQDRADAERGGHGRGDFDWMGYGWTKGIPDWQGKTWGVQDPTGKSLHDRSWSEELVEEATTNPWGILETVLGFLANPQLGAMQGLFSLGKVAAKTIGEDWSARTALQETIDNPDVSPASRSAAQAALDQMNQWQTQAPTDYSETEGDRILEERLKAEVPCAPGERGWPECEADVEEPSAMSKYFKTKSKDKDDDPYKGFEKILRDIYGEDWRAILAEMRKRGNT